MLKKIGIKLTLEEYFNIPFRESDWRTGICYECIGKPNNILEELAYGEIEYHNELDYCRLRDISPELLIESRTDWESMKGYADSLANFIDRFKAEIGMGRLKFE